MFRQQELSQDSIVAHLLVTEGGEDGAGAFHHLAFFEDSLLAKFFSAASGFAEVSPHSQVLLDIVTINNPIR